MANGAVRTLTARETLTARLGELPHEAVGTTVGVAETRRAEAFGRAALEQGFGGTRLPGVTQAGCARGRRRWRQGRQGRRYTAPWTGTSRSTAGRLRWKPW
ncbi:hypothetical protein ACQ4WX_48290 [Streptomyces lasalocidi]